MKDFQAGYNLDPSGKRFLATGVGAGIGALFSPQAAVAGAAIGYLVDPLEKLKGGTGIETIIVDGGAKKKRKSKKRSKKRKSRRRSTRCKIVY